jgi:hypothetical protein
MTKWEYTIHVVRITAEPESVTQCEQELNELGALGWEVVSVLPASGTKDEHGRAILKRQKAPGRLV